MSRVLHSFQTQESLVEALGQSIMKDLQEAIEERGKASLIVSGGSTPKPLFQRLSTLPLAWEKVSVGLCDERWIPAFEEDSNEHLVKTYLLQDKASKATFVGMYVEACEADEAVQKCSQKIKERLFPFDVLVLGMGADAHTASLFPHNVKLGQAFDLEREALCIAIEPTTAPYMRMSLTRKALLSAQHIYLHFEGKEKQAVYAEVIAGDDSYAMPIRTVLNQNDKQVKVYYR